MWQNTSEQYDTYSNATAAKHISNPEGPSMTFRFVVQTGLCMPIALLGLVGNIIAWIVLLRQRPRLTTTVLLMGLAVADNLFLITTILTHSLRYINLYSDGKYLVSFAEIFPYIFITVYPSVYFIRMVDTWLIVLLTVDRFIAVYRPLHAQGLCTLPKAYRNMAILVFISLLFSLPRFFEYKLTDTGYKFASTDLNKSMSYMVIYKIILFILIMYIIPTLLLVILNTKLLLTLRRAETYRASLPRGPRPSRSSTNRSVTTTVVAVVAMCIISNIVATISHIVYSLENGPWSMKHLDPMRRYLSNINNLFITISCATNFLIYCLCSRNFRMVLVRTFRCHSCINSHHYSNGHSSSGGSINTNASGITNFSLLLRVSTKKKEVLNGPTTKILKEKQESLMV